MEKWGVDLTQNFNQQTFVIWNIISDILDGYGNRVAWFMWFMRVFGVQKVSKILEFKIVLFISQKDSHLITRTNGLK